MKDEDRDPDVFGAQYLQNGWRYKLGYNGHVVFKRPTGMALKRLRVMEY